MPLGKQNAADQQTLEVAVVELVRALNHNGELWVEIIQGEGLLEDRELPIAVTNELYRIYEGGGSASGKDRGCGVRGRLTKVLSHDIREPIDAMKGVLGNGRDAKTRIQTIIRDKWSLIRVSDRYDCGESHTHFHITTKV